MALFIILIIIAIGLNLIPFFVSDMGFASFYFYPLFLIGAVLLYLLFCCIVSLFVPRDNHGLPSKFMTRITRMTCKFITFISNVKLVVKNRELLDKYNNYLLVSNHQSNYDPICQIDGFKDHRLTFIMKKNIMKVPVIGNWLYSSGHLPLDRENNRHAVTTIRFATERIIDGYIIGAYPEGTRSKGPEVGEFKDGLFKVAVRSRGPIAVVIIDNAYKVHFHTPFRRTKVLLKVCKVIEYDEYKDMNTHEISTMVRDIIVQNIEEERKNAKWLN